MKSDIKLFEQSKIRSIYDEEKDVWYFSVIDVIAILSESKEPKRYWSDLKRKLNKEAGSDQPYEKIVRLKMLAADGKMRDTDAADAETMLRIVQSVPSPKAEPIKQWLARVGYWKEHEITKDEEYAILTNIIHQEWSGLSVREHKQLKGLKSQNLRDHMSEAELIFTALAELSTRQVAENMDAKGMSENKKAARRGGNVARVAKEKFEEETGQSVVTNENYLPKKSEKKEIE